MTAENNVTGPRPSIKQTGPSWLEERLGESNGNTKIRTAKASDDGERHANHFSIAIDERPTRPTGSGLRIVDNFVRKNVADMALSNQRANEFAPKKFVDNLFRLPAGGLGDFVHHVFARARKNGADTCGIAKRKQRLAADCRFLTSVHFQDGFFQAGQIAFQHREVRYVGNLGNADGNTSSRIWKIGSQV